MIDYEDLKKNTYLFLRSDNENVNKLIDSILLITLCHDKCVFDNDLLVNSNFISKCSNNVIFTLNYDKMSNLGDVEKFSLVRNKLAHGDFVFDDKSNDIYIKILIDGEEVFTKFSLDGVVNFAKEISNYYDYLRSDQIRRKVIVRDGVKMIVSDLPKKNRKRSDSYNKRYWNILSHIKVFPNLVDGSDNKKLSLNYDSFADIDVVISGTSDDNYIIDNLDANSLEKPLFSCVCDGDCDSDYKEVISLLRKFYVMYLYPLENFLKVDDKNVYSLLDSEMFDFSKLSVDSIDDADVSLPVGKVSVYFNDLDECYKKISFLIDKKQKIENDIDRMLASGKVSDVDYQFLELKNRVSLLESEIVAMKDFFCNSSVKMIYEYSKNRSIVEHLRCSIAHGDYFYDCTSDKLTFFDKWKDDMVYKNVVTCDEFRQLFNYENVNAVNNHFIDKYSGDRKR